MLWVLIAVIVTVAYWVSLKILPEKRCRWCKGSKVREDRTFWRGTVGRCWVCKGGGKRIRWGVVLFDRKNYHAIKNGEHGRNF